VATVNTLGRKISGPVAGQKEIIEICKIGYTTDGVPAALGKSL
jgi:hypothetical protein